MTEPTLSFRRTLDRGPGQVPQFPHTVIPAEAGIQCNSGFRLFITCHFLLITVSPLPTMFQPNELYEPNKPN